MCRLSLCLLGLAILAHVTAAVPGKVGGFTPIDNLNDETVQKALKFGEKEVNARLNSLYFYRVANLMEGQKQVVAGILYRLKVQMKQTECTKRAGANVELQNCAINQNAPGLICTLDVVDQPWKQPPMVLAGQNCVKEQ